MSGNAPRRYACRLGSHAPDPILAARRRESQAGVLLARQLQHALPPILAAIVVLGLLLSRSHYSIDIAGGALLAYFVEREWTDGHLFDPLKRLVVAGAEATPAVP